MNRLWLSAIAAACLLAGNAAQAGDHGRRGGHDDWDRGHREYRRDDHDRGRHEDFRFRGYSRPVVYVPGVVYSRPVYYERPVYYSRPAYYGTAYGGGDGQIHGSITFGF